MLTDLHMHTNHSDGKLSVHETIKSAKDKGIKLFSITDHDSISGVDAALKFSRKCNMTCISGMEFSCRNENANVKFPQDISIHILAYNIDYTQRNLQHFLSQYHFRRKKILLELIEQLLNEGFDAKYDDISVIAGTQMRIQDIINHINSSFIDKEEKARLIKIANNYYLKLFMEDSPLSEAIRVIKQADGIPVLAHSFYSYHDYDVIENTMSNVSALIDTLCDMGIEGIEVFYPKFSKEHTKWLLNVCQHRNLMITAGSDFHGTPTRKNMMNYEIDQISKTVETLLKINKYAT